jgi:hypothetical protein
MRVKCRHALAIFLAQPFSRRREIETERISTQRFLGFSDEIARGLRVRKIKPVESTARIVIAIFAPFFWSTSNPAC